MEIDNSTKNIDDFFPTGQPFNIVQLFEQIVRGNPHGIALDDGESQVSYHILNEKADQLANYLSGKGIIAKNRIGVCLGQSPERVIAFLAVLKLGAAYLPIDGDLPEMRIKMMMEDADVNLMLTEQHYYSKVCGFAKHSIAFDAHQVRLDLQKQPHIDFKATISSDYLAYIIYTSGSTGLPKGVMISHRSLFNFVRVQAEILSLNSDSKTLQFASPSFDAAVIDIWVPLLCGAKVHLYPNNKIVGEPLLDFIVEKQIDTIPLLPPAVLATLPTNKPIGNLRTVAIGGEACTENTVKGWYKKVKLINSYGPTEATVAVTNHLFKDDTNPRLIGKAMHYADLYVLNEARQEVGVGEQGELLIGGPQLALGYINRTDETENAFIKAPEWLAVVRGTEYLLYRTGDMVLRRVGGDLEFQGRRDEQVKIRGYRIELAEIEHHLSNLPGVFKAAVKVHKPEEGNPLIVAFIQINAKERETNNHLGNIRTKLQQAMPSYMVPDKVIILQEFPLTHAGKIDRAKLLIPDDLKGQRKTTRFTGSNLLEAIKNCWKNLLEIEDISDEDDFFDLGGHSLLLAQLHVSLPEIVRSKISLPELYTFTTICSLIKEVEKREHETEISQKLKAANTISELENDAELQFDFFVDKKPDSSVLANPKYLFLTGVTGFVGSHLLEELLKNTKAIIYCLVRASSQNHALERIKNTFQKFNLSWLEDYDKRVKAEVGDLSMPDFGMDKEDYAALSDVVEVIYHAGSSVSYVQPYSVIKKSNIDGLHAVLHLAINKKLKYLVLLSSMGVFSWGRPFTNKTWMYEDDLIGQNLDAVSRDLGYIKSKWVMERLAEKASAKGLPIINFRLGFAVCHGTTGATVMNQWWGALIRSCVELKSFPLIMGLKDELTTVDYMCKAIVHISKRRDAVGKNFHLSPYPENDVSLTDFCSKINEYYKLDMEGMEYHRWLEQWRYNKDLPIYPLLSLFIDDVFEGKSLVEAYEHTYYYDRSNTAEFLNGTDIVPPIFDDKLMKPYLKFMGIL